MTKPLVSLPGIVGVAYLESLGGTVVSAPSGLVLSGAFCLTVCGHPSLPVIFGTSQGAVVVVSNGPDFIIAQSGLIYFDWDAPVRLTDTGDPCAPWLEFAQAWLIQTKADAPSILGLDQMSVSLVGDASGPAKGMLAYPKSGFVGVEPLAKLPNTHDPKRYGYFVMPLPPALGQGYGVRLGEVSTPIILDHGVALELAFREFGGEFWFDLQVDPTIPMRFHALSILDAGITLGTGVSDGGIRMASSPGDAEWGDVALGIQQISSRGGALRVEPGQFALGRAWIARTPTDGPVDDATGLLTPTGRLGLELGLPLKADLASLPLLRLTYRDPNGSPGSPPKSSDRHFGVRVAGLGSRSGAPATLDATLAAFELGGTVQAPQLHLCAGDKIGNERSVLSPKPVINGPSPRWLAIPVGGLALELDATAAPSVTSCVLDTGAGAFTLIKPQLVGAPVGITSRDPGTVGAAYARWALCLTDGNPELPLTLTPTGLKAPADWASRFRSATPGTAYAMIDHPGAGVTVDPLLPATLVRSRATQSASTSLTIVKQPNGKEIIVYSAFVAGLAYLGCRRLGDGNWEFLDTWNASLELSELDKPAQQAFVKNATVKGLQVVYFGGLGAGASDGLHKFIEDNRLRAKNPNAVKYYWPFTSGLSIVLRDATNGQIRFADEIALVRTKNEAKPGIAFDMSAEATLCPTWFDWTGWDQVAKQDPSLWPRFAGKAGARLDPTVDHWRGILMRDLPLEFPVPQKVLDELPWAATILKAIGDHLMLDYAYQDETGITWKGGISGLTATGEKIPFAAWDGVFEAYLMGAHVLGAANKMLAAQGSIRFLLPRITSSKTKKPIEIGGVFGLDLEAENPLYRIDIQQDGDPLETDDVPGFASIQLKRIITDFKTVNVELSLVATASLAQALPFLSGKPQAALLTFDLQGQGPKSLVFDLAMPAEAPTHLFGRWPFTVHGMRIEWSQDSAQVVFRLNGRLNLGSGDFGSIGASVLVTKVANGDLSFDLRIDQLEVSLSLGSTKIKGMLFWGKPPQTQQTDTSHPLGQLDEVRDRDLWGSLEIDDGGFLGHNHIVFRAGNSAEINYWIASLDHQGAAIDLGIGKLENAGLLLAHNADFKGNLATLALKSDGDVFVSLRPGGDVWGWLENWNASSSVGTVVAGSGFFKVDDFVVTGPVKAPDDPNALAANPDKLSGILYIDTGVLRVDGYAQLFSTKAVRFTIAVDFQNSHFTASIQTAPIAIGKYLFNPGTLTLGIGFKGSGYFDARLGWPPRIGSDFERDWSQALSFHADDLPLPVNTGWGGVLVSMDGEDNKQFTLGVAFRCGWTKQNGDVSGGSGGGFDVGYAIGGVVQFQYAARGLAFLLPRPTLPTTLLSLAPNQLLAKTALQSLVALEMKSDIRLKGELFGDVWGSAWLKFMGITLAAIELKAFARYRICGSMANGITDARASCGFSVSVKILCVTYQTEARYDLVLIKGSCPIGTLFSDEQLAKLDAFRASQRLLSAPRHEGAA
jgi:hypothetical protein